MAIGGLSTAIGTLSIGCLDTTSLPALSLRSQFAPAYGFDWDIESTSIGRLDLYRVNAGTRTLVMSVLRQQTRVGINKVNPGSTFAVGGLPTFASNAAATGGGLTAGDFYTDGAGNVKVVF
jgi:hypothetical protein